MIQYDFYESPKPEAGEETKYHIRAVNGKVFTTREVATMMQKECTITTADVALALSALSSVLENMLSKGNSVRLDGVGTFRAVLEGKVEKRGRGFKLVNGKVRNICFKPDGTLLKPLRRAALVKSETRGTHSRKYAKDEIIALLNHYFENNHTPYTHRLLPTGQSGKNHRHPHPQKPQRRRCDS